jgi:hypothetical protein
MIDILYFAVTMNLLLYIVYLVNKNNILKDELKKKENLYNDNDSIYTRPN